MSIRIKNKKEVIDLASDFLTEEIPSIIQITTLVLVFPEIKNILDWQKIVIAICMFFLLRTYFIRKASLFLKNEIENVRKELKLCTEKEFLGVFWAQVEVIGIILSLFILAKMFI